MQCLTQKFYWITLTSMINDETVFSSNLADLSGFREIPRPNCVNHNLNSPPIIKILNFVLVLAGWMNLTIEAAICWVENESK